VTTFRENQLHAALRPPYAVDGLAKRKLGMRRIRHRNPTIALVMRFDNIEHAQAARDQLWQPAGASRDASAGEAAEVQK
jgi:hypothetical protein